MKLRIIGVLFILVSAFGVLSCGDEPGAEDPDTLAAALLTQATYRIVHEWNYEFPSGDFTGSDFYSESALFTTSFEITLEEESVNFNEDSYTINGTFNYGFIQTGSGGGDPEAYSVLLYGSGISIDGPDFSATVNPDFKADLVISSETVDSTVTVTISATVTGTVAGQVFRIRQ